MANNRYKIRLSNSKIFWNINSIDKPAWQLWTLYKSTFIDINGTPINWVDAFTITTILDSSEYTMLELTDTVDNSVLYFLNNQVLKKLSNGFEIEFKLDIFLSFGLDFYQWLSVNNLPITVKRFLNNKLLIPWFQQKKFLQQDDLLNFKNGTVKVQDSSQPQALSITAYNGGDFRNGNINVIKTFKNTFGDSYNINIVFNNQWSNWQSPIFHVFENTDGTYYCFLQYDNNNNIVINLDTNGDVDFDKNGIFTSLDKINWIKNSDYWINKYVGAFVVPSWKHISDWFVLYDDNQKILGFSLNRSGVAYSNNLGTTFTLNVTKYAVGDNTFACVCEPYDITTGSQFGDYHVPEQFLYYNPQKSDLVLNNHYGKPTINSYFFSQIRFNNSTIQFCPVNNYYDYYFASFLEFDGNQFNQIINVPNQSNLILEFYPTINVSIDSYKEYVAQTKPLFNTSLAIAKQQMTMSEVSNAWNGITSIASSLLSGAGSAMSGNFGAAASSGLNAFKTLGNTVINGVNAALQYQNVQKQQDAQLASARLSSTAKNINSTNTSGDCIQKFLIYIQNINIMVNNLSPTWDVSFLGNFISNFNDLQFLHNLIWKNGIIGNMFINSATAFNDTIQLVDGTILNKFIYLDFECDETYIRQWKQNLPSQYVDALKVITSNSIRFWFFNFDITNPPSYYIAFGEMALQALKNPF